MTGDPGPSILVSCTELQRNLPLALELDAYLRRNRSEPTWLPVDGNQARDEQAIEGSEGFVVLVDRDYANSTALAAHLLYADGLRTLRRLVGHRSRPRILALSVGGVALPAVSAGVIVEWLAGPQDARLLGQQEGSDDPD